MLARFLVSFSCLLAALYEYVDPCEDSAGRPAGRAPGLPAAAERACGINFGRFKKMKEFSIVEKSIDVVAPLRDKRVGGILRLQALRSAAEPGYLVAVYRQMSGLLPSDTVDPDQPEKKPASVCFWAQYDLIQSNLPTAEKVLGFLEMRGD